MRILLATDGSENALAGARLVSALSLAPEDAIGIVSIITGADAQAAACAVSAAAEVLPNGPTQIETILHSDHPTDEILKAAAELPADLLVLGARGHSGLAALLLGSVADQVLRQAPCPVLLARPGSGTLHRVMLGTDGSPGANRATECLARLPLPADCEVRLLTLLPVFDQITREHVSIAPPLAPEPMTLAALQQREAQHHLDAAAGQLIESGKRIVTEIRGADAAEGLLAAAREEGTDLLAIGSHTQSRMERFFLGSVSETVAHHAPCSVLVVR